MSNFWQGRNVLVSGGSGFIGSHVTSLLVEKGARVTATTPVSHGRINSANLQGVRDKITVIGVDLTRFEDCLKACQNQDVVINAAHFDGNVAVKRARPAFIFRQNMLITLNMLEAACRNKVERFLVMSSAEVYAPEAIVPTPEAEGFTGLPDRLTDGYAWSKRMSEFAGEIFAREYGLQVAVARLNNIYGPRDHFVADKGRVIPMFIKKVFASDDSIVIWGNGEQVRSFLYVEDLARGLLDLVERHSECDPINFSGSEEITIRGLAELIARLSGRKIRIICDPTKPAGPPIRILDTTKTRQILGFSETVRLEGGLRRTIEMYREYYLGEQPKVAARMGA